MHTTIVRIDIEKYELLYIYIYIYIYNWLCKLKHQEMNALYRVVKKRVQILFYLKDVTILSY